MKKPIQRVASNLVRRRWFLFALLINCAIGQVQCDAARPLQVVDDWRYSLKRPVEGWKQPDFDDSAWAKAKGGLGTSGTPGARIGLLWTTDHVWLRKRLTLARIPANPALMIHHDDDAQVYLNGHQIGSFDGYTKNYTIVPIAREHRSALHVGRNLLAVHCRQGQGGQFIDVHLIDAANPPELPRIKRTAPFKSQLITTWGERVTPENAWTEYPRPLLMRPEWQNLNGNWDYAITPIERDQPPENWAGKILVPYCLESRLGGVQRLLDPSEALWYRRFIEVSPSDAKKTLLHFEAVDYLSEVFVNGQRVGTHKGGNTPFSFDISEALQKGENELIVRVRDETEKWQLRGKQSLNPRGVWYTRVSGIWQTVWLEQVPETYIADLKIDSDPSTGTITLRPKILDSHADLRYQVIAKENGRQVAEKTSRDAKVTVKIENAKLWSPSSPHLYDLDVKLLNDNGKLVDRVESYAGIRSVGKERGADGHLRFTLNGKPIFHWGPLDQGWWPDGLLTPPSDEAMLFDIEFLKSAGFNMIRKHIKVEPRRYYYHCDRLGMMVWQDQVSGGKSPKTWVRLEPGPRDAKWPVQHHEQFMFEFDRMISTLESHPSIVMWVPFNERWGQHKSMKVGQWAVERDPKKLINIASGGNFWPVGDVVDAHNYPHPKFPFDHGIGGRFRDYVKVMGEFGGHGYAVDGHLWDVNRRNWGYGGLPKNEAEFRDRYQTSLDKLDALRQRGIAGGVYTQTTDVEGEINGLMTYDRRVVKIPAAELADLHQRLFVPSEENPVSDFPPSAFVEQETDRKPGVVMNADSIRAGLAAHDRALYIKSGWIRDPYITLGPDDYFYLTGTQPRDDDRREVVKPYNIGLGSESIVGDQVRAYRSRDLIAWESLGPIFSLDDTHRALSGRGLNSRLIWAPELHWLGDRWALVHCPKQHSSLALSTGQDLRGPWTHPMDGRMGPRHDPSLFTDDDGTRYLLWGNTFIAPLSDDLTHYTSEPVRIDPAGSRPGPQGKPINRIGHEGATMIKVGNKYVHLGTAWSTDRGRKGSYNLYYCVADSITGPYGPRKFAGRFLGHGTPFQDKSGQWWCTAFFNGNVPPLPREGIRHRDLGENAQSINEQGVTIVPLDVRILANGDIHIRAKDADYAYPGPDEAQQFPVEVPTS